MPSTITALFTFEAGEPAIGSEVDVNFSNLRGTRLPIHESTATAADNLYSVGNAAYYWSKIGTKHWAAPNTSTVQLSTPDGTYQWLGSSVNIGGTVNSYFGWVMNGTIGTVILSPTSPGISGESIPGLAVNYKAFNGNPIEISVHGQMKYLMPSASSNHVWRLYVDNSGGGINIGMPTYSSQFFMQNAFAAGNSMIQTFSFSFILEDSLTPATATHFAFKHIGLGYTITLQNVWMKIREVY